MGSCLDYKSKELIELAKEVGVESTPAFADKVGTWLDNNPSTNSQQYEGDVTPSENTIFVFGSNPEGRHGAGAAKVARNKFGAIYGQGEGLQGSSYALPTKDLRIKENSGFRSISIDDITSNISKMYEVAKRNPTKEFKVAFRNTDEKSLNGYTGLEMIEMFNNAGTIPTNIIFSKEWNETGLLNLSENQSLPTAEQYNQYISDNKPKVAGKVDRPQGLLYAEIRLPALWKELFEDPFWIGENGDIDFDKVNEHLPEILDMLGYRIPNEDKYSSLPMRAVGFLPSGSGGAIMMPAEITTIDGSDMDVDKRYCIVKKLVKGKKVVNKFTKIKEGVSDIFIENPELAKIGSKEEYSAYMDGIFPNSKVKDIVYHGSPIKDLNELKRGDDNFGKMYTSQYGIAFTDKDLIASHYAGKIDFENPEDTSHDLDGQVYRVVLNIKNPKTEDFKGDSYKKAIGTYNLSLESAKEKEGNDSFIAKNISDPLKANTYVVFEPEQIHILGSNQDIEGFKKFKDRLDAPNYQVEKYLDDTNSTSQERKLAYTNRLPEAQKVRLSYKDRLQTIKDEISQTKIDDNDIKELKLVSKDLAEQWWDLEDEIDTLDNPTASSKEYYRLKDITDLETYKDGLKKEFEAIKKEHKAVNVQISELQAKGTVESEHGIVMDGVESIFEQNPTLSKIGNKQQYSKYLYSIFPDSNIKGINYHGTEYSQKFEKFDDKLAGTQTAEQLKTKGFWFTYDKDVASDFGNNVISVLLNIKNPYKAEAKLSESYPYIKTFPDQVDSVNKAINDGYDGAFIDVLENLEYGRGTTELVVFNADNIHILGSKQDINGFKQFIKNSSSVETKQASTSKLQSLYNQKTELYTQRQEEINNLISDEEFNKLSIPQQNTKGARDNERLDIFMGIYTNPYTAKDIMSPGGYETVREIAGMINKNKVVPKEIFGLDSMDGLTIQNMQGRNLKGIAVSHSAFASKSQYSNLKLNFPVRFDGKDLDSLNGTITYNEDGSKRNITTNFAETVAAAVDNGKDPLLASINYNQHTADTISMLYRSGHKIRTIFAFVNQPIILKAMELVNLGEQRDLLTSLKSIAKEMKVEYQFDKIQVTDFKQKELVDMLHTSDNTPTQGQVLANMIKYVIASKDYSTLISATKSDTKGIGKFMEEGITLMRNIKKALTLKTITGTQEFLLNDEKGTEELTDQRFNNMFYKYGVKMPIDEVMSKIYPYINESFSGIKDIIEQQLGYSLSADEAKLVDQMLIQFHTSKFDWYANEDKNNIVKNLPNVITALKADYSEFIQSDLVKPLFNALVVGKDIAMGMNSITFDNTQTASDEQREDIKKAWASLSNPYAEQLLTERLLKDNLLTPEELVTLQLDGKSFNNLKAIQLFKKQDKFNNPEVQQLIQDYLFDRFANNLIRYSFFTTGLNFTPKSISSLIPISTYSNISYNGTSMTDMIYGIQNIGNIGTFTPYHDDSGKLVTKVHENSDAESFIDQFYKHMYNNQKFVPRVSYSQYDKTGDNNVTTVNDKQITIVPEETTNSELYEYKDDYLVAKNDYISVKTDGKFKLYKNVSSGSNGYLTFERVELLGVPKLVYEFDANNTGQSIIPGNNIETTNNEVAIPSKEEIEQRKEECK